MDEDKAALVLLAVTGREAQNLPPVTVEDLLDGLDLGSEENRERRRLALRAINKLNELGLPAVRKALGPGYDDASGEFAIGVGLKDFYVECLLRTAAPELFGDEPRETDLDLVGATTIRFQVASYKEGVAELEEIQALVRAAGYGEDRIKIDPSVVRGLEYYTGPVFEAELLAEIPNEDGQIVRFGSVGGGGRYDGLVSRFRGEPVPATGFSIGVSRLMTALKNLGKLDTSDIIAPVVVLVMDKDTESLGRYQKMVGELRAAGIRAEMYLGGAGMKAQMKYADRRGAPCVIIQGGNEREEGTVQIKDLVVGAKLAAGIADHDAYKEARPGQVTVPEADLVAAVRGILDAQKVERG
ncbi:hypothetical protein BO068_005153 [Escherichia coli]|nr:hypothetical protein [Escherichia coli]